MSEALRRGVGHLRPDEPKQQCAKCGEAKPLACFKARVGGKRARACKTCTPEPAKRRDRATAHFARMGFA